MPDQPLPTSYLPTVAGGSHVPAPRAGADLTSSSEAHLRRLHQRWVTVVDGCFENEMECGDGEPVDALRAAWAHALQHSADIKRELDTWIGDPVHDQLTEHHLLRLAQATGLLRPGHTAREGLAEVQAQLVGVRPAAVEQSTWLSRHRRAREERRLIYLSMRPS
jgi:hypothetical protein